MQTKLQPKLILVAILAAYAMPHQVLADSNTKITTDKIDVVGTTPLQGIGLPLAQIPANVQQVKGEDLKNQ